MCCVPSLTAVRALLLPETWTNLCPLCQLRKSSILLLALFIPFPVFFSLFGFRFSDSDFLTCIIFFLCRTFNISCRACLLAVNFLSFCLKSLFLFTFEGSFHWMQDSTPMLLACLLRRSSCNSQRFYSGEKVSLPLASFKVLLVSGSLQFECDTPRCRYCGICCAWCSQSFLDLQIGVYC